MINRSASNLILASFNQSRAEKGNQIIPDQKPGMRDVVGDDSLKMTRDLFSSFGWCVKTMDILNIVLWNQYSSGFSECGKWLCNGFELSQ